MRKYHKRNLKNIQNIFEEKTGISVTQRNFKPDFGFKRSLTAVAAMLCILVMSAFAYGKFSSLDEDGLSFCAHYRGDGVFEIMITNISDKDLKLQDGVKLMRWSTAAEIPGNSDKVKMENRTVKAHSEQTVRVDLSDGYNIDELEEELPQGDWYYLVLTNNNFAFGQDWMCDIVFDVDYQPESIIYVRQQEYDPSYPDGYELAFADWIWPTVSHAVSYPYGKEHNGVVSDHINIAGNKGDEIYAVADGKVLETGYTSGYGNYIILDLGNDIRVQYGHLQECKVNPEEEVEQGQVIATLGQTGRAAGPNLALIVWVDGETVNPLADGE